MLTIVLILSLSVLRQSSDVNAVPLATVNSRAIDSTSCDCPIIFNTGGSSRSIWDIVWSCLLTIFACTWLAVHLNIPADGDSFWIVARRRLQVMAYAILAPEMTILWAMRQWVGARQLKDKYQDRGWTKTHGFFIQMGGFRLLSTDVTPRVLSPEEFEVLLETGEIDFPSITEEEIADRSKSDMLAKSLVVFQTFWFIVQCIARGVQGLVITELELVTLAFAALNGVMYFFWWHKPLDVRSPVTIHLKEATESKLVIGHLPVQQENLRSPDSDLDGCVPEEVVDKKATKTPLPSFSGPAESASQYSWKSDSENQGFWHRVLFPLILRPIRAVVEPIRDMANANEVDDIKDNSRVPTYYAYKFDREWELRILFLCTFFGVVFGSIHCIAWAFTFPSHVERMLWRTASLIVTCVPLLNAILCILYSSLFESLWQLGVEYSIAAGFVLYGLARMVLLVQAFTSLRALTPLAYETVQWTLFIPHIF